MNFNVSVDTNLFFSANHGMTVGIGLNALAARNGSASLALSAGYLFRTPVKDFDLLVCA